MCCFLPRFFVLGTNLKDGMVYIRGRDADHIKVLRIRPGERVTVCDGEGTDYECRLVNADKEEAQLEILQSYKCTTEPSTEVKVLCGLPKGNDRQDYIIQKSVECGANSIGFFDCKRCVARPEHPEKKIERWQRIAEEAAKQAGRGIIPKVYWCGEFVDALNEGYQSDLGLFLYETGEREKLDEVIAANKNSNSVTIITGPEGGFEAYEADMAKALGLHVCSMGNRILRCETAPVAALVAIMFATGNMS